MTESIMSQKAMDYAVKIVELHKLLVYKKKEYQIADQIKRSGTAIGALLCEAKFAESTADYIHKMKIALKECHETSYWLALLHKTDYIDDNEFKGLMLNAEELFRVITAVIRAMKEKKNV